MALAEPSSPIPADLGQPLHTFQCPGPGSFFASVLAFLTFRKYPFGLWTVTVCENGVASRDTRIVPNPDILQNLDARWDDFVAARSSLTRMIKGFISSDFNIYVYDLADGTEFGISNATGMKDTDRLALLIQDEVFKRQLPQLSHAFNSGQEVNFGRITIDKECLKWDSEQIPWEGVERVSVDNGEFIVQRVGASAQQMQLHEVKNFDVLWTLLASIVGEQRRG